MRKEADGTEYYYAVCPGVKIKYSRKRPAKWQAFSGGN